MSNAFTRGELRDHTIITRYPTGFEPLDDNGKAMVGKLKVPLYGTKQAARLWNQLFTSVLLKDGWRQLEKDPCIFTRDADRYGIQFIGLYVDDIIHLCDSPDTDALLHTYFNKHFPTTSQGEATWILQMEIKRDRRNRVLSLNQSQKILSLLESTNMDTASPVKAPMVPQWKYGTKAATTDDDKIKYYRSTVGSLAHIASATRPDIAYTVNTLCRHFHNPNENCFAALTHLLNSST